MKKNKKGFTIVELVIVIAVIAILAAVLIPTFSNVIANANKTAALEEGRNEVTSYLADNQGVFDAGIDKADDKWTAYYAGDKFVGCVYTDKGYQVIFDASGNYLETIDGDVAVTSVTGCTDWTTADSEQDGTGN